MSKNSNAIERAAVSGINDAFFNSERLTPYIPTNDKEPVWDGHIYISHGERDHSRIPVQVKGKIVKKLPAKATYAITLANLENYKRDGGVVYFLVLLLGDEKFKYLRFLAPLELGRLIRLARGKKQTTITFEPFSEVTGVLEDRFIQFYHDCKLQTSFVNAPILDLEKAIRNHYQLSFPIYVGHNEHDVIKYVMNNSCYLYANIENSANGILYPIGDQPLNVFSSVNKPVYCGGVKFFDQYQYGAIDGNTILMVDEFLCMKSTKDGLTWSLEITADQTNLNRFIQHLTFMYYLSKELKFYIGNDSVSILGFNKTDKDKLEFHYRYWDRVSNTLKRLHCNLSIINISAFSDKDMQHLDHLAKCILDGQEVCQHKELRVATTMQVGPFRILLKVEKLNKDRYKISDFFSMKEDTLFSGVNEYGERYIVPIYSVVFQRDDFDTILNIDYDDFIKSYERAFLSNKQISFFAYNDVFKMIIRYDRAEVKERVLLEKALQLSLWILDLPEVDNTWLVKLDILQISKRMNYKLTDSEIAELIDLSETDIPNYGKWAANLLLEDYQRADRYWSRMSEHEKTEYSKHPIYYFQSNRLQKSNG